MAIFDQIIFWEKGQGTDPCLMQQDCSFYNVLTSKQHSQLATPKEKKPTKSDRKANKKDIGKTSSLIDYGQVFGLALLSKLW